MDIKPCLIEPGMKYFLNETLKQCHIFKINHNNTYFDLTYNDNTSSWAIQVFKFIF